MVSRVVDPLPEIAPPAPAPLQLSDQAWIAKDGLYCLSPKDAQSLLSNKIEILRFTTEQSNRLRYHQSERGTSVVMRNRSFKSD